MTAAFVPPKGDIHQSFDWLLGVCPVCSQLMQDDIICTLQDTQLDNRREYCALSYTWGYGQSTRVVTINGENFPVTKNLYCTLRQLRNDLIGDSFGWLWVDACINQASVEERNN